MQYQIQWQNTKLCTIDDSNGDVVIQKGLPIGLYLEEHCTTLEARINILLKNE